MVGIPQLREVVHSRSARPTAALYQNIAFLFMRWFQISDKGGPNSITGWGSSVISHDATGSAGRHQSSDSDPPFRAGLNYAVPSMLFGRPGRKLSLVLAALLCAVSNSAEATIINAASPSLADVTAAIKSARDGDTVILPAGTAAWKSPVKITKGITLMGQTTTDPVHKTADDQTVILVGTGANGNQALIDVNTTNGKSSRISGITFRTGRTGVINSNGMLRLNGASQAVRVDHCHFDDLRYENDRVSCWGPFGVIDHNLFNQSTNAGFPLHFHNQQWNGDKGKWGDKSWAEPPYYGSEKFMFVEDNCFNNTSGVFRGAHDAVDGARFVFRHNHCYDMGNGSHGTEVGRFRGVRAIEIYNNDYHWTFPTNIGGIRSGSFLTHDNTHDGKLPQHGLDFQAYRQFINSNPVFGASTGDNPWDYNATEPDGSHVDGHPPYLFDKGTAQAGSGQTTIVDATKNWSVNKWAGYTAKKPGSTNPGIMLITGNTATTLTGLYHGGFNGGVTWAAGDAYEIHKVLISMDQPCRGGGDLLATNPPINSTTNSASWVHQALEPCYSWNDIYTPNNTHVNISPAAAGFAVLKEGRDFFNNTPMPGYKPYTYPHPLTISLPPAQPSSGSHHSLHKSSEKTKKRLKTWKWGKAKENSASKTAKQVAPDH
jgi:hypothetical protein